MQGVAKVCTRSHDESVICENLKHQSIRWEFNPPQECNMGSKWERIIRSIRIFVPSLLKHKHYALLNVFPEVESKINSQQENHLQVVWPLVSVVETKCFVYLYLNICCFFCFVSFRHSRSSHLQLSKLGCSLFDVGTKNLPWKYSYM